MGYFLNSTEANIENPPYFCIKVDESARNIFQKGVRTFIYNVCHYLFTKKKEETNTEETFYLLEECIRIYNESSVLDCSNSTSFSGKIIRSASELLIQLKQEIPIAIRKICNSSKIKPCTDDSKVIDNDAADQINNAYSSHFGMEVVVGVIGVVGVVVFLIKKYRSSNTANKSDADVESETPCLDKSYIKEGIEQVSNDFNDNATLTANNIQVDDPHFSDSSLNSLGESSYKEPGCI
ncbi:hypothetical protein [Orientia tsutsugamushi]|uniref:hypothetical protein n=1 Tax=Orientia tsutsugamushi TaxID=784 RepID=UPI000D5A50E3|nr:Uncharacterised protein [Orientia tsutsugamushi]